MSPLFRNIFHSFPIQLLLLHIRKNLMLLIWWLFLIGLMAGYIAPDLGVQYLFLDPEYLGQGGFWSFLLVGLSFGFYVMSWNLSTYLLLARNFEFLASLSRPFLKWCINNALLPLSVLFVYLTLLIRFNGITGNWLRLSAAWGGLLLGVAMSLIMYMIYFYLTNRDVYYYTGNRPLAPNQVVIHPQGRQRGLELEEEQRRENPYAIGHYLDGKLRSRLVRSVAHYNRATLESVFRQHHWNALFLQLGTIITLVLLGLLIDQPFFQFPAGCSILILLSMLTFFVGVIHYWFAEWRFTILAFSLVLINWMTSLSTFQRSNFAYGINYDGVPAVYTEERLRRLSIDSLSVTSDSLATIELLNNWLARQEEERPKMMLFCSSGGGLTAAYWSTLVADQLERATGKKVWSRTALLTGASGGMIGMAYLRELQRQKSDLLFSEEHYRSISSDLLNPIAFSIVSNDIFLPFTKVTIGDETYLRDRAYSFERQLNSNTNGLLDLPLSAYREAEQRAEIPLMILTPTIVNDGRLLTLSAQNTSYLMNSPVGRRSNSLLNPDFIGLESMIGHEQRDSLRFLTALRMNATYPYVLPFVQLPTKPIVRVMDAGYRDNYGVLTAARFVQNFAPWIREHTSGVIMIQISAFRNTDGETEDDPQGLIESLFQPVNLAHNVFSVQSLEQENTLSFLYKLIGEDRFHLFRFNYQPQRDDPFRASVTFHLTEREQEELQRAVLEQSALFEEVAKVLR
jgi:hypothetical protein